MDNFKPDKLTIHVVAPERVVNYKWENEWKNVSRDLELRSVDELNSLPTEIRDKYFDVPSFQEGMILILDRINNRYYSVSNAADEITQNKDRAIDKIAALLGARSIEREVIHFNTKKRELSADGKINVWKVNASASYKETEQQKIEKRFKGVKEFRGNHTREGYQQALNFCKETGLIYDPAIKRMLEDRNPDHPNPLLSESYNVTLTNEVENAIEAAFSLSFLKCFSVSANVKEAISTSRTTELKIRITYGDK